MDVPSPEVSPRAELAADVLVGAADRLPSDTPPPRGLKPAALLFLLTFACFVVLAPLGHVWFGLPSLILAQPLSLVLPVIRVFRRQGQPLRHALSWRPASSLQYLGAALLGAGVWSVLVVTVLPLQNAILPIDENWLSQREDLFIVPETFLDYLTLWLAAAVTPALCEETLFRGAMLYHFRARFSDRTSVLLVAALFAVFHLNPYQLSFTFVLGAVMGWLTLYTGSIRCAMLFHLLNNSMVLLFAQLKIEEPPVELWLSMSAVALGGAWLVWKEGRFVPEGSGAGGT